MAVSQKPKNHDPFADYGIFAPENRGIWRMPRNEKGQLPHYCRPVSNPKWLTASEQSQMLLHDPVVSIIVDDQSYVMPWWIMKNHHVANLILNQKPFLINFCEACTSSSAHIPVIHGKRYTFRIEGSCNGGNIITDFETESLWSPFMGQCIEGSMQGAQFDNHPVFLSTWEEWIELYPNSLVLDGTGESRLGHGSAEYPGSPAVPKSFVQTLTHLDKRLPHNTIVLGLSMNSDSCAYPLEELHKVGSVMELNLGTKPIVIFSKSDSWVAVGFEREVDGNLLSFSDAGKGFFIDDITGSKWDISGKAIAGPLQGKQLPFIIGHIDEWFAWAASYPESRIFNATQPE